MKAEPLEAERRETARRHLDSAEAWLRRLIDYQLTAAFGADYWDADISGEPLIKPRVKKQVADRRAAEPARYSRNLDAMQLPEAIGIVLHPRLYAAHFRAALVRAYPDDGQPEARTFLNRLNDHRNRLSHVGTCSQRDLEQCVCYSNDLVDSLKLFFRDELMDRVFNVPTFSRVVDNRGNEKQLSPTAPNREMQAFDFRGGEKADLYPGDMLEVEVEVDESFSGYTVQWMTFSSDRGDGPIMQVLIEPKHVGLYLVVRFEVTSGESWHRLHGGVDDRLELRYRVLPPVQ